MRIGEQVWVVCIFAYHTITVEEGHISTHDEDGWTTFHMQGWPFYGVARDYMVFDHEPDVEEVRKAVNRHYTGDNTATFRTIAKEWEHINSDLAFLERIRTTDNFFRRNYKRGER